MIREGSGTDLVSAIREAKKALVFISVPWSISERNARQVFRTAAAQLEGKSPELGVEFFRLNVDEDEVSQQWLSSIGFLQFASIGVGSLLWLCSGQVVASEISTNSFGVQGVVDHTTALWKT
jgi:hypothetical protein